MSVLCSLESCLGAVVHHADGDGVVVGEACFVGYGEVASFHLVGIGDAEAVVVCVERVDVVDELVHVFRLGRPC